MKKRNVAVFSVLAIMVLGIGAVSAFGFGQSRLISLDEEERVEMQKFQEAVQLAVDNGDYESWRGLMESKLTEEHFEEMREHWTERTEKRTKMQEAFESGEMPRGQGDGMHKGMMNFQKMNKAGNFGECPYADSE